MQVYAKAFLTVAAVMYAVFAIALVAQWGGGGVHHNFTCFFEDTGGLLVQCCYTDDAVLFDRHTHGAGFPSGQQRDVLFGMQHVYFFVSMHCV